jgi:hypothetical protein
MSQQLWQSAKLATMGGCCQSPHEVEQPARDDHLGSNRCFRTPPADARHRALMIVEQEVERMAGW